MTKIQLPENWWRIFNPEEFNQWVADIGILEDDWDFMTSNEFAQPVIMFECEKDAIAFRLRFSI